MRSSFRLLCVMFCLTCMIAGALSFVNHSNAVGADDKFATVIIKNASAFGSVMMAGESSGCLVLRKGRNFDGSTATIKGVKPHEVIYSILYTGGMCAGPGKGTMPAKVTVGAAGTTTILTVNEQKTIPAVNQFRQDNGGSAAGWPTVIIKNVSQFGSVKLSGKSSECLRLIKGQNLKGSIATIHGFIPHEAIYPILYTGGMCAGPGKGTMPAKATVGAAGTTTILTIEDDKLNPGVVGVTILTVKDKSR